LSSEKHFSPLERQKYFPTSSCDAQKLISSLDNVEKGQGLRKFQFGQSRQIYFLIFSSTL
jgi:hypothetical protein